MTCENIEGFSEISKDEALEESNKEVSIEKVETVVENGVIKIRIEEGTGIYLEIPDNIK